MRFKIRKKMFDNWNLEAVMCSFFFFFGPSGFFGQILKNGVLKHRYWNLCREVKAPILHNTYRCYMYKYKLGKSTKIILWLCLQSYLIYTEITIEHSSFWPFLGDMLLSSFHFYSSFFGITFFFSFYSLWKSFQEQKKIHHHFFLCC